MSSLALLSVNSTLARESEALHNLSAQYETNSSSQLQLLNSISIMYETTVKGGKIVCCGIGKSYKIATKTVATFKSLSINTDELHPSEALHGDLGVLRDTDCLIFFTSSGNTPELIQLLPHISPSIPIILLTCARDSMLSQHPQIKSLLYAELPSHLKESSVHGVPAPTISATLSLALADSVALALAEMIETDHDKRKKTFSMKHPGGSIGSDLSHLNDNFSRIELPTPSSTVPSRNIGSFSSMLSLNQVSKGIRKYLLTQASSSGSSPTASDSEEAVVGKLDVALSSRISGSIKELILETNTEVLLAWTEEKLLKAIAMHDFIVCKKRTMAFALDSLQLRILYQQTIRSTGWRGMSELFKCFRPIETV